MTSKTVDKFINSIQNAVKSIKKDVPNLFDFKRISLLDSNNLYNANIRFNEYIIIPKCVITNEKRLAEVQDINLVLFYTLIKFINDYQCYLYSIEDYIRFELPRVAEILLSDKYEDIARKSLTDLYSIMLNKTLPYDRVNDNSLLSVIIKVIKSSKFTNIAFMGFDYNRLYKLAVYLSKTLTSDKTINYIMFNTNTTADAKLNAYRFERITNINNYIRSSHNKMLNIKINNVKDNNNSILFCDEDTLTPQQRIYTGNLTNVIYTNTYKKVF